MLALILDRALWKQSWLCCHHFNLNILVISDINKPDVFHLLLQVDVVIPSILNSQLTAKSFVIWLFCLGCLPKNLVNVGVKLQSKSNSRVQVSRTRGPLVNLFHSLSYFGGHHLCQKIIGNCLNMYLVLSIIGDHSSYDELCCIDSGLIHE